TALWEGLQRLLAAEPDPPELGPPAEQGRIDEAEAALGLPFPAPLCTVLRWHSGACLGDNLYLHDLDAVVDRWRMIQEIHSEFDDDELWSDEPMDGGRVRDAMYHPYRIPFGELGATDVHLLVDCAPGPAGAVGQVIMNLNECEYQVIAADAVDFLV